MSHFRVLGRFQQERIRIHSEGNFEEIFSTALAVAGYLKLPVVIPLPLVGIVRDTL